MNMDFLKILEALPGWTPFRELTTKSGPLLVSETPMTPKAWDLWNNNVSRAAMQKVGFAVRKAKDGQHFLVRAKTWMAPEVKKALVEESRAASVDDNLMIAPGQKYLEFQKAGIKYAMDRLFGQNGQQQRDAVLIGDGMGLGKQQQISCQTLTPSGWRKIGDLVVGDQVINADGAASTVTGVFPQGIKPIYEVEFSDGVKTNCGLEHLWEVRDGNMATRGRGWTVMTLAEMMKRGLQLKSGANKFEIPQFPGHLETHGAKPEIGGWPLGQLIGNGSTGGSDSEIKIACNSLDTDVIDRLESHGGIETSKTSDGCTQLRFPIHSAGRIMDDLRKLGLNCKSKEKSLHPSLFVAPWAYRVDLLQGLMDANGSNNKNRITYHTCSTQLAQDVAQLVRSLGGAAVVRKYDRSAEGKPTEWQVNVHTRFCPFWSARKAKGWKADTRSRGNRIQAVRYLYDAEAVCIMVDHPRHLYVTEGYKLTHNTVQAIGVLNQDPSLHTLRALVICPASLKINWRNEMRKFLMDGIGHDAVVIQKKWPGGLVPPRIAIVNYDVIHKFHDELCATKWDYLIFDEAHYLKNETTRWTVYALGGMRKEGEHELYTQGVDGKYTLFLTGTPIPNRVKEAWPIVKRCDPYGLGASYPAFYARYCKSNENLAELQERMRVGFMVRRTKEEVFKDFPAKIRSVFCIDPAECHGINVNLFREEMSIFKEYQEMLQSWQARAEIAKAEGIEAYKDIQKEKKERLGIKASELAKLRMKTAIAKAPAVADRVAEHAQGGAAKVLVFGHHREVLNLIEEGCKKHGLRVRQINGDTPKDESPEGRQGLVDAYQRGELDVMVLGYKPGGVGLTLTKASVVVMAEPDYVPGNMTQAEDRAHRIGLDHPILVEHDVLEGSLDEFMARILIEKQDTILRALDFNEDEDLEETQETWAVKERAATQGVSAQKIEEESLRMTSTMRKIADDAAGRLLAMAVGLKNVDREILEGLRSITNTRNRAAMHRRFALKYRDLVPDAVEDLKWKIEPLPGTKTSM